MSHPSQEFMERWAAGDWDKDPDGGTCSAIREAWDAGRRQGIEEGRRAGIEEAARLMDEADLEEVTGPEVAARVIRALAAPKGEP